MLFGEECSAKNNVNIIKSVDMLIEKILETQLKLIREGKKDAKKLRLDPGVWRRKEFANENSRWTIF